MMSSRYYLFVTGKNRFIFICVHSMLFMYMCMYTLRRLGISFVCNLLSVYMCKFQCRVSLLGISNVCVNVCIFSRLLAPLQELKMLLGLGENAGIGSLFLLGFLAAIFGGLAAALFAALQLPTFAELGHPLTVAKREPVQKVGIPTAKLAHHGCLLNVGLPGRHGCIANLRAVLAHDGQHVSGKT